jgi:hypothetical protein
VAHTVVHPWRPKYRIEPNSLDKRGTPRQRIEEYDKRRQYDGTERAMSAGEVWSRSRQRLAHVVLATALGVYLYSPLGDVAAVEIAVQVLVFPALALSGLLMWKGHRLRARLGR